MSRSDEAPLAFWWRRRPDPFEAVRTAIRSRLSRKLTEQRKRLKDEGRFPFEGGWHSREEIAQRREESWTKDRERMIDVLALLGGGFGFVVVLVLILIYLLG